MGSCLRPTDTQRALSADTLFNSAAFDLQPGPIKRTLAIPSPRLTPPLYHPDSGSCQEHGTPRPPDIVRLAVAQGAVSLSDKCLSHLRSHGIAPEFVGSSEEILRRLDLSLNEWDVVVYPIWTKWQHALDFARDVRRIRERHGAPPHPKVLVLSFVDHEPTMIQWFRRTNGTAYRVFTSQRNFIEMLWVMREELLEAQRAYRLHLRFVHSGNPSGLGCVPREKIVAVYGSFLPGQEAEIAESQSVLRFINLLATGRWRFRSARDLVDLMTRNPFYREEGSSSVPSVGSVKTYVARADNALSDLWRRLGNAYDPPALVARESRGGREVAYRLLCTAEFEHV